MKIAFNAIRVSRRAGSGFDTFIINFINEFAKYVYSNPKLNVDFDVYTLYPQHFSEVKKENIKQILKFKNKNLSSKVEGLEYKNKQIKKQYISLLIKSLFTSIYFTVADYFRMFWTQIIFPFYAKNYDLTVAMTQLDASFFCNNQAIIIHDMIPFIFPKEKHKHKFFLYKFLPKIISQVRLIFTISENTKKDITKFLKVNSNKIIVIYEGSGIKSTIFFSDAEKRQIKQKFAIEKFILYVGSYHYRKNLVNVIKGIHLVIQKIPNVTLLVVGYIPFKYIKKFQQLVNKLTLHNNIKFLGHLDTETLQELYSTAEIFVFPTLYEGFGLPPLEAMACGCPVVVSNCGALPEVCGDAAVYVNPYDPQDIADGILKVLTDEDLRQRLIKKGFEQVKKFTWENSVIRFIEALKNLQNSSIK